MPLSIIIPVLNEAERLPALLQFFNQYGQDHTAEIIVVDGNSTDDSVQVAQKHGALVIRANQGRAAQMNAGAAAANGDILYFVHADTTPPNNFAPAIEQALQQGWQMGCFRYRFDSGSWLLKVNAWFTRFHFLFCQGGDKTFFIQKSVFQQMKGYDERFVVMEEYDFLKRIKKARLRFVVLPYAGIVSARKYSNRAWFRVQIANLVVFNLWNWGLAKPEQLRSLYKKILA
jgi:rSAM/selenodomain-associated transferase 2